MLRMFRTRSTQSLINFSRSFSHNDIPVDFPFNVFKLVTLGSPPLMWCGKGLSYKSPEVVVVGLEVVKYIP